jgi:hypothetical protein
VRPGISPPVFVEVLKFVYSGKVDFAPLDIVTVLELMAAAVAYDGTYIGVID